MLEYRVSEASQVVREVDMPEYCVPEATQVVREDDISQFALDGVDAMVRAVKAHGLDDGASARVGDELVRISYAQALQWTLEGIAPLGTERVDLAQAGGRVAAEDLFARVNSPSLDASLKDGYAVQSADIAAATPEAPVCLKLLGCAAAGQGWPGVVRAGTAVRVLSGAPIPQGAQAVVSAEFATDDGQCVTVVNDAHPGRNILRQGGDIALGQRIVAAGDLLQPMALGLLAAAGHARVPVFRRPRVAILATGDEVVAPGKPLAAGKLYASNLVTLAGWCTRFGMPVTTSVVPDRGEEIRAQLRASIRDHDAVLTSGGAWNGERDLVVRLLEELGWQECYHRVRIGPGKAVGFGLWEGKPVFCLPGGPPSNHMAFLQLALPGLHRLGGYRQPGLSVQVARLAEAIRGQKDWTQFVHGRLQLEEECQVFHPLKMKSRLQEMAHVEGIVMIPEGIERIAQGTVLRVQTLVGRGTWDGANASASTG
jgi:molybdopterin molybdotransferase